MRAIGLSLIAAVVLSACGGDSGEPVYIERPASTLYDSAQQALNIGDYGDAAELFQEVERQHPYSPLATQSQLMAAFSLYQELEYDEAIIALDRFIRLHPGNDNIDYAYYLRALSYYERISDVERDQAMTELAMDALGEVVRRFPDTAYARDARLKLDLTNDQLAGREMAIGRFYLTGGHYNAAINRFRAVIDTYETTTHVPEALHRLTEAYLALGLEEEARNTAAVLAYNYPGSEWYVDSYALLVDPSVRPASDSSLWDRMVDSVF